MDLVSLTLLAFAPPPRIGKDLLNCIRFEANDRALYLQDVPGEPEIETHFPIIKAEKSLGLEKYDVYIVQTEDLLSTFEDLTSSSVTWNSRAKFIILNHNPAVVFNLIHKYNIYNVIVLSNNKLYTYFPYRFEDFANPNLEPVQIESCEDAFPPKLNKLWRNSTLKLSYLILPPYVESNNSGLEVQIVQYLADILKCKIAFDETAFASWGVKTDTQYDGAIGTLQRKEADFVIGHFHLRDPSYLQDFDVSCIYVIDELRWVVPGKQAVPHWANLILVFHWKSWLSVCGVLSMSGIIWYLSGNGQIEAIYMVPLKIKWTSKKAKAIYLSTWLYWFVTNTIWNSRLIFFLTHETYGKQISSYEEIFESGLKIGYHSELETYLNLRTYVSCEANNDCLDRVAFKRDLVTVTSLKIATHMSLVRYIDRKGFNLIGLVDNYIVKDYTVSYFQKGHPVFQRANEILYRLTSSGLIDRLERLHDFSNKLKLKSMEALFETKVLGMDEVKGEFMMFLIGIIIATICFVGEFIYYKYNNKNPLYPFHN